MPAAHAAADRARLPKLRDLIVAAIVERVGDGTTNPDAESGVRLNRVLYMGTLARSPLGSREVLGLFPLGTDGFDA